MEEKDKFYRSLTCLVRLVIGLIIAGVVWLVAVIVLNGYMTHKAVKKLNDREVVADSLLSGTGIGIMRKSERCM